MPGISITDLRFTYPGGGFGMSVGSLEIAAGEKFALLGPSGAGKTTLLRLMTGLLQADSGRVCLGGTELASLSEAARREFRLGAVGLVFQDFALMDYLTVEENILLPHAFRNKRCARSADKLTAKAREYQEDALVSPTADITLARVATHARTLAERLEINQHWQRLAGQLSQGERQRVAVARALAHRPRFLFADEPTASLDARRRGVVMDLLFNYIRETGAALVMVTHDTALIPLFECYARVEDFTK